MNFSFNEEENLFIQKFDFYNIEHNVSILENEYIINFISNHFVFNLVDENVNEYDFNNVTRFTNNNLGLIKVQSLIDVNKFLYVLYEISNNNILCNDDYLMIRKTNLNNTLTGTTYFYNDISNFETSVLNGNITNKKTNPYGQKMKDCMDDAYDSMCDGFLGCTAWYLGGGEAMAYFWCTYQIRKATPNA